MTHRDELLSIQARVEAQERAIDEAKSEIALLRAAHAQKTREAETLRRELDELRGVRTGPAETREEPKREADYDVDGLRWSMRLGASIMAGVALVGSMMLALGASRGGGHTVMATAPAARSMAVTPLAREGHVIDTFGPEVVAIGDQCTVERLPAVAGSFDCRIEVRCGDQVLYGSTYDTGYVRCGGREVVRDADVTARDGDPAMTLDLARGIVTVEERVGLGTQRVQIALDAVQR